jgi:NADH:ubiquinone oxidoreductase subunit F (NADH-binding)
MTMADASPRPAEAPAAGMPRLLAAGPNARLAAHRSIFGDRPHLRVEALLAELQASGLAGRGGAGFPAFRKLAATEGSRSRRRPAVIANGAEGEPWSWKDAVLLSNAPHLVIDGLLTVAEAVKAARIVVYVQGSAEAPLLQALAERPDARRVEVVVAPDAFVAGEASAVVNAIQRDDARPADRVRRLSEAGLDGRPTLLHNVETLAHLALVARYGAAWFRSVGHPSDPGTRLVTVTGDVENSGVVEVPTDTVIADIVRRAGGDPLHLAGLLVGGYHGTWLPASAASSAIDPESLARYGAQPGAGVLHVLGDRRCGLAVTAAITSELAAASAGQCGPCRFGLPTIASRFAEVAAGRAAPRSADELARLAELVDGRGACHHPDGTARLVRSALRTFGKDVHAHAAGRCTRTPGNGSGR